MQKSCKRFFKSDQKLRNQVQDNIDAAIKFILGRSSHFEFLIFLLTARTSKFQHLNFSDRSQHDSSLDRTLHLEKTYY